MEEQRAYPFEFSIIMSVYNVEPWIREAVDSLIAQDFGFENIQLVMVDDGSTDGSGAICDEYAAQYPENVVVVHKKNGGLSSARNAGVRVATGRYLNFFDPDDLLDPQVLSSVHKFLVAHEDETDVVAIPIMHFGALNTPHWANGKFDQGDRVLDLDEEWHILQMSLACAFLRADKAKALAFQEDLIMACAEDSRELIKLFVDRPRLGVVNGGYYRYRKHSDSQTGTAQTKKLFYIPYLKDYDLWAIQYCLDRLGTIPKNVQYTMMYDLQWKIRQEHIPNGILTNEETVEHLVLMRKVFHYIDDDVILEQPHLFPEHKMWVIEQKYGKNMQALQWNQDAVLTTDNAVCFSLARNKTCLEFLKIENEMCTLEGYTVICPVHNRNAQIKIEVNGKQHPCEIVDRNRDYCAIDEPVSYWLGFRVSFPLCREDEKYEIKVITEMDGVRFESRNLNSGRFFPVSRNYQNAYDVQNGWKVSMTGSGLTICSCGRKGHIASEWMLLKELWKKNELGNRKAVLARIAYHMLRLFKHKPIWLISDRIVKADDNGEAFFRYMQKEHKGDVKSYFILSKKSSDYQRMKKLGPMVDNLSWKHKMLFLLCDYNISAQADAITTDPFPGYEGALQDILSQKQFVFLQHGVTQNDLSNWLNRYSKNIYGFVTAAYPEYQSILDGKYFYDKSRIWLTGFPRFDRRYCDEKNCITIMPTWRMYLLESEEKNTGIRKLKPGFKNSVFFAFYQALLNNQKLIAAAEKFGYRLRFFAHPNIQPHLSEFDIRPEVDILNIDTKYNDIYAQSNLIVTDYSSAVFDFAYLRKPIIYCQFDFEEFFAGSHVCTRGYFDYAEDGFGEVEYDLEGTVNRIIEYMENGCQLKNKYRERIDKFFAFNDQNNCRRLYEKIMELEADK